MTNDQAKKLLDEAEDLLRTAWAAMLKMGLRDRGSDIGLSHEVRMFAAHFSEEGRDGPGALQIRGTGRFRAWLKAHREARARGVQGTPALAGLADYLRLMAHSQSAPETLRRWADEVDRITRGVGEVPRG